MMISIGGSVTTGSTPWIDIFSSYEEVKVLKGELRIGESGLYNIASRIYLGESPTNEEFIQIKKSLLDFGQKIPMPTRFAFSFLARIPSVPVSVVNKISDYRLKKRAYDKSLPGFTSCSHSMLEELECLVDGLSCLDISERKLRITNLMNKYISSLSHCVCGNNEQKIIVDQLVAPRLLFDETNGPVISEILGDVKIIVIRRDPRDQFIDLLLKKKKYYHLMSPGEAASVYVNEYLPRYDRMSAMLNVCDPSKVMDVWFEDLFFDFEIALYKLESFIGLKKRPADFENLDFSEASRKIKMYNSGEFSEEVAFIKDSMSMHLYRY